MRWLLILCVVASAGLVSGPADARLPDLSVRKDKVERRAERRDERRDENREPITPRRDRSADAARRAQMRNGGGRVLSVEPDRAGYRVKVIKDGEVRVHHVDSDEE